VPEAFRNAIEIDRPEFSNSREMHVLNFVLDTKDRKGLTSTPMADMPRSAAVTGTVPHPQNGSMTTSSLSMLTASMAA
jgi:hypothetical protein